MGCGASKSEAVAAPEKNLFDDPQINKQNSFWVKGNEETSTGARTSKQGMYTESNGTMTEAEVTKTSNGDGPKALVLPDGWKQKIDPHSGQAYYVNHTTEKTVWSMPDGTTTVDKIPGGWTYTVDPSSGKGYYVNEITGISQWDPPPAERLTIDD